MLPADFDISEEMMPVSLKLQLQKNSLKLNAKIMKSFDIGTTWLYLKLKRNSVYIYTYHLRKGRYFNKQLWGNGKMRD